MKKTIFFTLISLSVIFSPLSAQITIEDVTMPKKVSVGNTMLSLKGAGLREKLWLDLYVAGLYVTTTSTDANSILNSNDPISIKLHIVSTLITSKKMIDAVNDGFKKSTNNNTAAIQTEITAFKNAFKDEIKIDDVFDIFYVPNKAIAVIKNGKLVGKIPCGQEFRKALFGIWIGTNPADSDLKDDLLGK